PAVAIATGDLVRPVAAALPVHLAELPLGGALERFIERLAAGLLPPGNDARRFPVQALRRLLVEVLVARQDHLVAELITGRQQRLGPVTARPANGTGERPGAARRIATSTRRSTIAARSATALARSAAATGRAAVAAGARASGTGSADTRGAAGARAARRARRQRARARTAAGNAAAARRTGRTVRASAHVGGAAGRPRGSTAVPAVVRAGRAAAKH